MTRIAVTSRSFSKHPVLRAELLQRYGDVTFNDEGTKLEGPDLISFLDGHDRAIVALETVDADALERLPELQVISKYGVGYDLLDLRTMARRGIRLGWTGGVNRRSVAELAIAFMIALLREVPAATADLRAGTWKNRIGRQLSERTVGIIGCGHVGKDLAVLLRAFGCRVIAHDVLDFPEFYAAHDVTPVDLETLLRQADVVTLHLPLDGTSRGILGRERLVLMKPDAILINTARGGLVDEAALREMLESGRLAGAGFDVFAVEPPEDIAFFELPNVLATPHIGGSAAEAILAMGRAAIAGLDSARVPGDGWPPGS